jgi:hypothetical protein
MRARSPPSHDAVTTGARHGHGVSTDVLALAMLALFLAVQPWSVLAAILLVTSENGQRKEIAYVGGWVTALMVVAVVTVAVYPGVPRDTTMSHAEAVVEIVAGLVVGVLLLRRWQRPREAGTGKQPKWMGRIDTMTPMLAFGLGAFLPTYAAVVAAVNEMLSSGLKQRELLIVAIGWVLLASAGVASPLLVLVTGREHAPDTYQRWRDWIGANSRAVLYAVGGLVCVLLVGKGIVGLVE